MEDVIFQQDGTLVISCARTVIKNMYSAILARFESRILSDPSLTLLTASWQLGQTLLPPFHG